VLRSPLLSFDELVRWSEHGAAALGRDELVARLRRAFTRPELREALLFASPELEQRLPAWLDGTSSDPKLDRTLARYYSRAASRSTPFGLFAGIAVGAIAEQDALRLGPISSHRRHTRLGMAYLLGRLRELGARDDVVARLRFEPSSTLYRIAGRIRFATLAADPKIGVTPAYPVVDVEPTPHLEAALSRATGGGTLDEIASALVSSDIDLERAASFVRELVDNQILVPCWLPAMSGREPFDTTASALREVGLDSEADAFAATTRALSELDRAPADQRPDGYRAIAAAIPAGEKPVEASQRFQTDLVKSGTALTLGRSTLAALLGAAELVQRVSTSGTDPRLDEFRAKFSARYEGRFVPLVEALDADLGIGYDRFDAETQGELLEDLPFSRKPTASERFDAYDAARLFLLNRALSRGERVHELDDEELEKFPRRDPDALPESFAVLARLHRLAGGETQIVVPHVIAPSAVSLMARFCHACPELAAAVHRHVELESARARDPLVDIVHMPHGHVANILLRPVLRGYEITYHGKSGAPVDRQLPLEDLYVGVEAGRLVLHSKRLGRNVSVRITNAHNFEGWWNLPLYRFLGALQMRDHGDLASAFYWGALDSSPFLPRIVRGGVVLSLARWNISKAELGPAPRGVELLRERLRLPRWVTLPDGDQRLVIDLDNPLSVEVLWHEVHQRSGFSLEEHWPDPEGLAASAPEGRFASEILLPFVRREAAAAEPPVASAQPRPLFELERAVRSHPPGSDWLYLKVYSGRSRLRGVLDAAVEALSAPELARRIERWFFVPFGDPDPHLRLRVQGEPAALLAAVLPALRAAWAGDFASGAIARLELATYERELERYGGAPATELAERLFHADSVAVARLSELLEEDGAAFELCVLGIHRLLVDFGLGTEARLRFARTAADDYGSEFGATTETWKKIGEKYRRLGPRLTELLFGEPPEGDPARAARGIFDARSERAVAVRHALAALGLPTAEVEELLHSYAHMHAIRVLGDSARWYELVAYDFLRRLYATEAARANIRPSKKGSAS
jgi:thiopeptide-type bacteriocin biosynthesis protein